eukprot:6058100-Pyramimonas_sp.AAC.1
MRTTPLLGPPIPPINSTTATPRSRSATRAEARCCAAAAPSAGRPMPAETPPPCSQALVAIGR